MRRPKCVTLSVPLWTLDHDRPSRSATHHRGHRDRCRLPAALASRTGDSLASLTACASLTCWRCSVARKSPYSGGMRAQDGVTVFASTDAGERDVFVLAGLPMRGALLCIARELDARAESWYIDVISSPTTIYGDLQ